MGKSLRILLVDDHRVLRTGMKMLLSSQSDFQVVDEASDGKEALEKLATEKIDLVLMDLSMPGMGGMECLREIRLRNYPVKVLILTMYSEQQYIKEVMLQGADGYLCKDSLDSELFQAIRTVADGGRYLGAKDAYLLIDSLINEPPELVELSKREREVLALLVHGYSLSVIAEKLYISIKTVSTYKTRLMQKLGCTQKSELVDYALKHNLLN
ncbi:MAG: response regulator transcription factor [Anaerovibrio sp.]|uniref:response regulator transcription factor n=1 Tax=Anaerovibrio sp. TaxID=1872532 RepID=UPI0025C21CF3|nr:response regulator transcription factor [Anaerovibrio sp.]MBE6099108.1 response regulator transcription factor [Anaerovibrio sp.]MBQ3854500.1 response regulator transcription factor [Anaerovibrio sp.]